MQKAHGQSKEFATLVSNSWIPLSPTPYDVSHYYRFRLLFRFKLAFVPILEPGQGFRDKRLLSRVAKPGQKVPDVKFFLHTTRFDHKTSCLAHGFLANSPK